MKRKPIDQFTGVTLEQWLSDPENIRWCQVEPRYRVLMSVVLSEAHVAHEMATGCSEARAFGRVEGYHQAIEVLRCMARKPPKADPDIEATHDEAPEKVFREKEPRD